MFRKQNRIALLARLGYEVKNEWYPKPSKNKYHAKKSGKYDSHKEARRAIMLKSMQREGLITDLREQVRFQLIPAQYGECGKDLKGKTVKVLLERACSYVADFVYVDVGTGKTVVEDTKGVRTPEYIIKRKLMLHVHGIRIREI